MSYGLKYRIEFTNQIGKDIAIHIEKRDYTGAVTQLDHGANNPQLDKDVNECFMGTSLEFSIESTNDAGLTEFYTENPRDFKVKVFSDAVLKWSGFLVPEQYSDAHIAAPFDISLTAVDGLGLLKNEDFDLTGNHTELDIVAHILAKTGLGLELSVAIRVWYLGQTNTNRPALEYTTIDCTQFYNEKGADTCYNVLQSIVNSYGIEEVYITQHNNRWLLFRTIDILASFSNYSAAGVYQDSSVLFTAADFGARKEMDAVGSLSRNFNKRLHQILLSTDLGRMNDIFPPGADFQNSTTIGGAGGAAPYGGYWDKESPLPLFYLRFFPRPESNFTYYTYIDIPHIQQATGDFTIDMSSLFKCNSADQNIVNFYIGLEIVEPNNTVHHLTPSGWGASLDPIPLGFYHTKKEVGVNFFGSGDHRILFSGFPASGTLRIKIYRPHRSWEFDYYLKIYKFDFYPNADTTAYPAFLNHSLNIIENVINKVEHTGYGSAPDYPNAHLFFRNAKKNAAGNDAPKFWYHINDTQGHPLSVINLRAIASNNRRPKVVLSGALSLNELSLNAVFNDTTVSPNTMHWFKAGSLDLFTNDFAGEFEELLAFQEQTIVIDQMIVSENYSPTNANPVTSVSSGSGSVISQSWNNITNKPTAYPPEQHQHLLQDITDFSDIFEVVKPTTDPESWYLRVKMSLAGDKEIAAYRNSGQLPGSIWDGMPLATALKVGGVKAASTFQNGIKIDASGFLEIDPSYSGSGVSSWNELTDRPTWLTHGTIAAFEGGHGHDWSNITGKPTTFTPAAHSQAISTITGLQTALDGKAASSHTHSIANVTGLQTALNGKAALAGSSTQDFSVKDLIIHGTVNHWLADVITVDDAKLQLNRSQGGATVASGLDIFNGTSVVSSLEYDTSGLWKAGGQRIYTDTYKPLADNATNLGGYSAASYPRKAEAAVITGMWYFSRDGANDHTLSVTKGGDSNFRIRFQNDRNTNVSGSSVGIMGMYYQDILNAGIRFHRGGGTTGGWMSLLTGAGSEALRIDETKKASIYGALNIYRDGASDIAGLDSSIHTRIITAGWTGMAMGSGTANGSFIDFATSDQVRNIRLMCRADSRIEVSQRDTLRSRWEIDGTLNHYANFSVSGTSTLIGAVTAGGNVGIGGTLAVTGAATLSNNLSVGGTINGVNTSDWARKSQTETIARRWTFNSSNWDDHIRIQRYGDGQFTLLSMYRQDNRDALSLKVGGLAYAGINLVSTTTGTTDSWNHLGINKAPTEALDVSGNIKATGNITGDGEVTAYQSSDIRLKRNVSPIPNALDIVNRINPVSFQWNKKAIELNSVKDGRKNYGVIAQELEEILPELIHKTNGFKSVDYPQLFGIMLAAIKELSKDINELKRN